tara:strand:- start:3258 stop:4283 length:1026 start_codon:yes stop_codon:yes gene_type:complete
MNTKVEEMNEDEDELEIELDDDGEVGGAEEPKKGAKKPKEDEDLEIEEEDDTPEADRDQTPLPKDVVDELDKDDLEAYTYKVKTKLKQLKKVWHDERRAKEAAAREQQEALNYAKKVQDENRKLRDTLTKGEKTLMDSYTQSANYEIEAAKRAYKEAHDSGDSDAIIEAQEKLNNASYRMNQIKNYKPALQTEENDVNVNTEETTTSAPAVTLDEKTKAWQAKNSWWGVDKAMTALALGFHQELEEKKGHAYVGTDEYWAEIDKTMKRRFPEAYEDAEETTNDGSKPSSRTERRPANVVAPATRSTAAKKIRLKRSELNIAKKLGLTPEQYAREIMKLEVK